MMRAWLSLTVAVCVALIAACDWPGASKTVAEARAENLVTVAVAEFDEQNDRVSVTMSRMPGTTGEITAVLPAGTVVRNETPSGQRLLTAATITLVIPDGAPETTMSVEVYCLDQFLLRPTSTATLALAEGMDSYETDETEPVRSLASCLEGKSAPPGVRQLAVWMVAGRYLDRDYSAVRSALYDSYLAAMMEQVGAKFEAYAARKRRELSHLPPERVEAALERYRTQRLSAEVAKAARTESEKALKGFRASRAALELCIDDIGAKPFFATA